MATLKDIKELALFSAKGTAPANYTVESVNKALADNLRELAGSINMFMKNRYDIYEIMTESIDEVVPNKVIAALSTFAEIQVVGQGQKAIFRQKIGRTRAKKFLTQVGLSGVYETFRLDTINYEVPVTAVGGGATLDFERLLDGNENLADLMDIIAEGLTDAVFAEVQKALHAALNSSRRPARNKIIDSSFNGDHMQALCNTVKAYGTDCVIFAAPEFIAAMGADVIVPVSNGFPGVSVDDIEAIHKTGHINLFRGVQVIEIPQSFTDETNTTTVIDPQMAYVLPTGGEKVVKVVLEGDTQIHDFVNRDNSIEIQAYKKMGSAILTHHNWGIYQNTGVTQTGYEPDGRGLTPPPIG